MSSLTRHVISNATAITKLEGGVFGRAAYLLYTANGDRYIVYSIDKSYDAVAAEYEERANMRNVQTGHGGVVIMDDDGTILEEFPFVEIEETEESLREAVDAIFRDEGGDGEFPLSDDMKEVIECIWEEIDVLRNNSN